MPLFCVAQRAAIAALSSGFLIGLEVASAQEANLGNFHPRNFSPVIFHTSTLFAASDGVHGVELWRTDGLSSTTLLTDLFAGGAGSYPDDIVRQGVVGEMAFFTAKGSDAIGRELYFWNGTTATLIKNLRSAVAESSYPSDLTVMPSGLVVFSANDGIERKLWVSDGTLAGTIDLTTLTGAQSPYGLTLVGSQVLFAAHTATTGTELWATQGTAGTTVLVRDIEPGPTSSAPSAFALRGSTLFFAASQLGSGREVWQSDGTSVGTGLAIDVVPGPVGSDPDLITSGFGPLAFTARDPILGRQLFQSNLQTTIRLTAFSRGETIRDVRSAILSLFFVVDDATNGTEVWMHDASGTRLVRDLNPGIPDSDPLYLEPIPFGGMGLASGLLWRANDGSVGEELWTSNGTIVANLANLRLPDSGAVNARGSSPSRIARASAVPPRWVFAARGDVGRELFGTDLISTWPLGDLKPLGPTALAEPELHIYDDPGTLEFTLADAPALSPGLLIIALFQAPSFISLPFLSGVIQVDLSGPTLFLPMGPTDAAGYASLVVVPPLAPANVPLAGQALVADIFGSGLILASNLATSSVYECNLGSIVATVSEDALNDDNGEYSLHLKRSGNSTAPAYYGIIRLARVKQGTQVLEEEILIESHPLEVNADFHIKGVIDLYPPEKNSDLKGDQLRMRLYDAPPTQKTVTTGCVIYTSYC